MIAEDQTTDSSEHWVTCLPVKPTLLEAADKNLPEEFQTRFLLEGPKSRSALLGACSLAFALGKPSQDLCFYLGSQLPERKRGSWREEGLPQLREETEHTTRRKSTLEWDISNFIFPFKSWELDLSVVGKQMALNKTEDVWHSHLHPCPSSQGKAG